MPTNLQLEECATIRNLQERPEWNVRHGKITKIMPERLGVQLFPDAGPDIWKNDHSSHQEETTAPVLSIRPDNLIRSDNPYLRLAQIQEALESFSFDACPELPEVVYPARGASMGMIAGSDAGERVGQVSKGHPEWRFCGILVVDGEMNIAPRRVLCCPHGLFA